MISLRVGEKPLILHPTGLTWDAKWGTFLGDTVDKKATIYRLDWERALSEGNLDHAVLDTIEDDAAINGCRPVFVEAGGRTLIATADYGDVRPELRLYDPERMLAAHRSSAPGVVVHRVLCGPFNQNLHWDADTRRLICIQNVIEGRGWRLDRIDLDKALLDGRAHGPGVRAATETFPPHDELEGFLPLGAGFRDLRDVVATREHYPRHHPPDRSPRIAAAPSVNFRRLNRPAGSRGGSPPARSHRPGRCRERRRPWSVRRTGQRTEAGLEGRAAVCKSATWQDSRDEKRACGSMPQALRARRDARRGRENSPTRTRT